METLFLQVRPRALGPFVRLFQRGCRVRVRLGRSVEATLLEELQVPSKTLAERVQTIFLDGLAVDDPKKALVREGAVLALSSAMPGLVGATFRKGGYYAPLRMRRPEEGEAMGEGAGEGMITLKLFNLILGELGPGFLRRGVWLEGHVLADFRESLGEELRTGGILCAWVDGVSVGVEALDDGLRSGEAAADRLVFFRVEVPEGLEGT